MTIDTTNRPRFPTAEEREMIAEMYRGGMGAPEIGRRIQRSERTVYQALRDRVVADPAFPFPRAPGEHLREPREVVDRVLAMVAAGKSDADIGAAVGKSVHAVSAMICRLRRRGENVPARERKPPAPRPRATDRPSVRPAPPTNVPPLPERAEQLRMMEAFIAAGRGVRFERRPVDFAAPMEGLRRVSTAAEAVEHMTRAGYRVRRKRVKKQFRYRIEGSADARWMLAHEFVGEVRDIARRGAFVTVPVQPEQRAA